MYLLNEKMSNMIRFVIAILLLSTGFVFGFNDPSTSSKIDPQIIESFKSKQEVEYLVIMKGKAAVRNKFTFATKEAKGAYVVQTLQHFANVSQADIKQFLNEKQVQFKPFWVINAVKVKSNKTVVFQLANRNDVEKIIADNPYKVLQEPISDRSYGSGTTRNAEPEWGIKTIKADSVWLAGITGNGVVIAGQDTGYDWDVSPIKNKYRGFIDENNVDHNYNWYDAIHEKQAINYPDSIPNPCGFNAKEPCDDHNHGTHTMGTMVGQDDENIIGVAPGARWIACRNMDRGWGTLTSYVECFEWFIAPTDLEGDNADPSKAPHVINNSWGCPEDEGCNLSNFEVVDEVINNVKAAGIVVVASAGNEGYLGCGSIHNPPAMFESSFAIGATDITDNLAGFSSRGPVTIDSSFRLKPNVVAPGVNVRSVIINGSYANFSGTSMAGPHVAGLVALMISANPKISGHVDAIEDIIESTSTPLTSEIECGGIPGNLIPNAIYGYGLVNALKAVERAKEFIPVKVDDISLENIRVIPNPVQDFITFSVDKGDKPISKIEIFNTNGLPVFNKCFESGQILQTLNTGHLQSGLYIYRIWVGDKAFSGKFAKI